MRYTVPAGSTAEQLALVEQETAPVAFARDPTALVVSVSGGIDSSQVALWARQRWPHHPIVLWHAWLQGHDWPQSWEQIGHLQRHIGNATRVAVQAVYELAGTQTLSGCNGTHLRRLHRVAHNDAWFGPAPDDDPAAITTLLDLTLKARNGQPPTKRFRYCTDYLKARACDRWLNEERQVLGPRPLLLTGERWAESPGRAKLAPCEWRFERRRYDVLWLRPIIAQRAHVVAQQIIAADSALVHEGYFLQGETLQSLADPTRPERGRARLSCVACVFSKQEHIVIALQQAPTLVGPYVARIQEYERKTGFTWQQRGPFLPDHLIYEPE